MLVKFNPGRKIKLFVPWKYQESFIYNIRILAHLPLLLQICFRAYGQHVAGNDLSPIRGQAII